MSIHSRFHRRRVRRRSLRNSPASCGQEPRSSEAGVRGAAAWCTENLTVTAPAISIAEPQTSPSPWAKCRSPAENSAPETCTGRKSRLPTTRCRMSRLPPFSRGGIVLNPAAAKAGTAPGASVSAKGSRVPPGSARAPVARASTRAKVRHRAHPRMPRRGWRHPGSRATSLRRRPTPTSQETAPGRDRRGSRSPE